MMADERYQLRKKRDAETSYEKTLNAVVSNSELQDKWNSAPFTWKYSYTLPETGTKPYVTTLTLTLTDLVGYSRLFNKIEVESRQF